MSSRWSFLSLLAVAFVALAYFHSESTAESVNGTHSRVKALMGQRHDVLAKRVEFFNTQFQNSRNTLTRVLKARDDLFAAELALAESRDARIDLPESRVENLKEIEKS